VFDRLKTLCELPGPGGDERLVQEFLYQRWSPQVKELTYDNLGSLIARVGGKGRRLLLAAHADEICFVVKSISEQGFLWITSGERDEDQRPSLRGTTFLPWGHPARVVTETGRIEGYFATLTGHILTPEQRDKTLWEWSDIFVEIGAASRAEAEGLGVQIGDRVIWNPPTRQMGALAVGKAMDDRAGLAVMDRLLEVLDRDRLAYDLTFVSTVQEEVGLVGAEAVANHTDCEMAISLDIGPVGDVPGVDARVATSRLGAGPIIVHKDFHHYNRPLTLSLIETARTAGIPVQPAVGSVSGYDSGAFNRHGLQAAVVAVPCRYTHSPFETIHLQDMERAVQLLKTFLEEKPASKIE
jgi:tetrahedral aminopeptidase